MDTISIMSVFLVNTQFKHETINFVNHASDYHGMNKQLTSDTLVIIPFL